ncbi:Uncharacterized protein HZ326_24187 [Fusarium oxysporum f. sp. albedinis]|nr:Uncharacterized protein HZ326_24187 [Fusarium oxysporum f. sp. albedinis]
MFTSIIAQYEAATSQTFLQHVKVVAKSWHHYSRWSEPDYSSERRHKWFNVVSYDSSIASGLERCKYQLSNKKCRSDATAHGNL